MTTNKHLEDYYLILKVHPTAPTDVIQAAYHKLAFTTAPDRNKSPDAHENMKQLNRAKDVLLDPKSRADYDRKLKAENSRRRAERQRASSGSAGVHAHIILERDEALNKASKATKDLADFRKKAQDELDKARMEAVQYEKRASQALRDLKGEQTSRANADKAHLEASIKAEHYSKLYMEASRKVQEVEAKYEEMEGHLNRALEALHKEKEEFAHYRQEIKSQSMKEIEHVKEMALEEIARHKQGEVKASDELRNEQAKRLTAEGIRDKALEEVDILKKVIELHNEQVKRREAEKSRDEALEELVRHMQGEVDAPDELHNEQVKRREAEENLNKALEDVALLKKVIELHNEQVKRQEAEKGLDRALEELARYKQGAESPAQFMNRSWQKWLPRRN